MSFTILCLSFFVYLWHWRELGHAQRQPLGPVAREVDLRTCIVACAFEREHGALAEFGMEYLLALAQARGLLFSGHFFLDRRI